MSLGVYRGLYGWALALGAIVSIYIHEMGHVMAIRRYGFQASAPMFIPGLGALIQLRTFRLPPIPDARIGLAGPLYGLGAAVVAYASYLVSRAPIWAVLAHFGAGCRGRDDHCWSPPAQIRTGASTHTAPASGDWRQSAA